MWLGRMNPRRTSLSRKPSRRCSCGMVIIVAALGLTTLLLFGLEHNHIRFLSHMSGIYPQDGASRKAREYQVQSVPELIEAIKLATANAHPPEFSELERASWKKQHPCKSRTELEPFYGRRKFAKHLKKNYVWAAVLREYSKLHRACMHSIDFNATRYFLARNESSGCKFAVAGSPGWAGLGNKVLPTLAVLLYAVLTQRVLLVPAASLLPDMMCEPFEGSSWGIDPAMAFTPSEKHEDMWRPFSEFEAMVDTSIASRTLYSDKKNYAIRVAHWCQPVPRFFCDMEQSFLQSEVPWLYFSSCIHFMPMLFAIPAFRPVLRELFSDGMATTHMIRTVMYPGDSVWTRVKSVDRMYLEHADRRVGVQIRYRDVTPQFQKIHDMVNTNVLRCVWGHGVLPAVNKSTGARSSGQQKSSVFVTSLFPDLRDLLSDVYHRHPPPSGDVVGIYQLSHGAIQKFGLEEDTQALTEVMCLSFSDDLLTTPLSTFGEMAQAYGALQPFYLEYRNDSRLPPCERAFSTEPCHQDAARNYSCPHDARVNGKPVTAMVSSIRACPTIFTSSGLQLVTRYPRHGEKPHLRFRPGYSELGTLS